jgi:hypothetical protein
MQFRFFLRNLIKRGIKHFFGKSWLTKHLINIYNFREYYNLITAKAGSNNFEDNYYITFIKYIMHIQEN